jgi:hypothetical protein
MNRTEYLAQPSVIEAIDELEAAAFAAREKGESEDSLPDSMAFLRERDLNPPEGGTIQIVLSVEEDGVTPQSLENQPLRPTCPDGNGECVPKNCKRINGDWVCSWVCHC